MDTENNNTSLPASVNTAVVDKINFFNPEHLQVIQRAAKLFINSELVPDMYKVSEKNSEAKALANCIIALDMANRIGASALMVMQNLIIIYGRPSWSSKFLVATVNTCGRFEPLKYKFEDLGELSGVEYIEYEWSNGGKRPVTKKFTEKLRNISCYAYTTSRNDNQLLEGSPITLEMAIKEGWYTRAGSKWKTMPKQMLMYRAASFWTNAYAPDLSMGMKTEFESIDIEEADYTEIPPDVETKVQNEIKDNANKEPLDIKPDAPKQEPAAKQEPPKSDEKKSTVKAESKSEKVLQDKQANKTQAKKSDLPFEGPGF